MEGVNNPLNPLPRPVDGPAPGADAQDKAQPLGRKALPTRKEVGKKLAKVAEGIDAVQVLNMIIVASALLAFVMVMASTGQVTAIPAPTEIAGVLMYPPPAPESLFMMGSTLAQGIFQVSCMAKILLGGPMSAQRAESKGRKSQHRRDISNLSQLAYENMREATFRDQRAYYRRQAGF